MTATITRRVIVTAADRPDTVTPEAGTVYLTFDDGPSANTEHLLIFWMPMASRRRFS